MSKVGEITGSPGMFGIEDALNVVSYEKAESEPDPATGKRTELNGRTYSYSGGDFAIAGGRYIPLLAAGGNRIVITPIELPPDGYVPNPLGIGLPVGFNSMPIGNVEDANYSYSLTLIHEALHYAKGVGVYSHEDLASALLDLKRSEIGEEAYKAFKDNPAIRAAFSSEILDRYLMQECQRP